MKIYLSKKDFLADFQDSMEQYNEYYWAVAWATTECPFFEKLYANRNRIKALFVNDDDYTSKKFKDMFSGVENVHIRGNNIHSKFYFFRNSDSDWCCFIGSANFTKGGFSTSGNFELMAFVDSQLIKKPIYDFSYDVLSDFYNKTMNFFQSLKENRNSLKQPSVFFHPIHLAFSHDLSGLIEANVESYDMVFWLTYNLKDLPPSSKQKNHFKLIVTNCVDGVNEIKKTDQENNNYKQILNSWNSKLSNSFANRSKNFKQELFWVRGKMIEGTVYKFHPKICFFCDEKSDHWKAIIGSNNKFTGLSNIETAIVFDDRADDVNHSLFKALIKLFFSVWKNESFLSNEENYYEWLKFAKNLKFFIDIKNLL